MPELAVVDTDILIDAGRGFEDAVRALQDMEQRFLVAVSTVTQMELIIGCRDKNELHLLDSFLQRFRIIPIDESISNTSVDLLKRYRLSHNLLIADALIAATAIVYSAHLASKNLRDYRFIKGLYLLPYPAPIS